MHKLVDLNYNVYYKYELEKMFMKPVVTALIVSLILTTRFSTSSLNTTSHNEIQLNEAERLNSNYVYMLNNDTNTSNIIDFSSSPLSLSSNCQASCKNDKSQSNNNQDQDTSASFLSPGHQNSAVSSDELEKFDTRADEKSNSQRAIQKGKSDKETSGKRNRFSLFKNQPKKTQTSTIPVPTTKSKRQDSTIQQLLNQNQLDPIKGHVMQAFEQPFLSLASHAMLPPPFAVPHLMFNAEPNHRLTRENFPGYNKYRATSGLSLENSQPPAFLLPNQPEDQIPHQLVSSRQPNSLSRVRDNSASQSIDHYQRIRMNKQPNEQLPMFYATGKTQNGDTQIRSNNNNNEQNQVNLAGGNNRLESNPTVNTKQSTIQQQTKVALVNHPTTTTTSMIGERAKNLISHINLANTISANKNQQAVVSSPVSNTGASEMSMIKSATNNVDLASMIKSAADAWAVNNANSGDSGAPTIVVEHDGPTITTVDFNTNLPGQRFVNNGEPADDDEDVSSFYAEENDETESEGSNEAKRIAKMRYRHPFDKPLQSHVSSSEAWPQDSFYSNNEPTDMSMFSRKKKVTNYDRMRNSPRNNMYDKYLNQPQYPDSINAIKQQSSEENGMNDDNNERNRKSETSDDKIEQLIKELQELKSSNGKKGSNNRNRKQSNKLSVDDEDEQFENDEDEQIKLVRKKLLAKLRSKQERREASSGSANIKDGAIKIPLHTLLLAALDRRMSPSEQQSQTIIQDLITDERNRNTVQGAQLDFDSVTSSLGNLMPTNIYEPIGLPRDLNEMEHHQVQEQPIDYNEFQNSANQIINVRTMNSTALIRQEQEQPASLATTHAPNTIIDVNNRQVDDQDRERFNRTSSHLGSIKKVRDVGENEGDFDVEKQIEDYSRDKSDPLLEPSWIKRRSNSRNHRKSERNRETPVEFDDDDDDDDDHDSDGLRPERRKVKVKEPSEENYERNESRFFNNLRKGTTDDSNPDETSSEEQLDDRGRQRRGQAQKYDDVDHEDDESDQRGEDYDGQDVDQMGDRNSARRSRAESRNQEMSTWRPNGVDREIERLEMIAQQKREARDRISRSQNESGDNDGDGSGNVDGYGNEDTSESNIQETAVEPFEDTSDSGTRTKGWRISHYTKRPINPDEV